MNTEIEVRKELETLAEEKYQKFSSKLIPNCNNLLGVRIPEIRKIAKRISKENPKEYIENTNELYFEETMLKGLIIGNLKDDIYTVLNMVENFVPKINNWSVCDVFSSELKIVRKNKPLVFEFLKKYYTSSKPYEIRFGVVMLLFHFIDEEYINKLFPIFDSIKNDNYYVKMAVAWAVSICFVKFPDDTLKYLKRNNLDDVTYNKSLQKIRESLRVSKETKEIIKNMKR